MLQIALIFLTIMLMACGPAQQTVFTFPAEAGPWKLKLASDLPASSASEPARRLGLKRAQIGRYEGPGKLEAEVYEMSSSAAAFEMEQTWRPAADTVVFHREAYFIVVRWQNADRAPVAAFIREMEKRTGR